MSKLYVAVIYLQPYLLAHRYMMEKRKCKHHYVCGLYAGADEEPPLCILHSKNQNKDKQFFKTSLAKYRREKGDIFLRIFFPEVADFSGTTFSERANFSSATFSEGADFSGATFSEKADFFMATFSKRAVFTEAVFSKEAGFSKAMFSEWAVFTDATFSEKADFSGAKFSDRGNFSKVTFSKGADFSWATFSEWADFSSATFSEWADFSSATFSEGVNFFEAAFLGKTTFIGRYPKGEKSILIFSGVKNEVNFRGVTVDPPQALIFRDADFSKCLFEQTDLRKAEFTGVSWPKPGWRFQVYDEIRPTKPDETPRWDHIERVYRELKQNYEDRRDYERAGDFHYGEKEMRRKNPDTPLLLKWLLIFYWAVSGYGERYIRPLVWAFLLLGASTYEYLILGIAPDKASTPLALTSMEDWLDVGLYSLQVMTLMRPADLIPLGTAATGVKVFQSLLGPIIIGLFALAVRQRLKR